MLSTIGYELTTQALVLETLQSAGVTHLIDVRAVPQSRKPGLSKRLLAHSLAEIGIGYTHLRGLGTPKAGRDAVRHGDVETMHAIFNHHMRTEIAQSELVEAIDLSRTTHACLLCFERDHTSCHRSIVGGLICEATGTKLDHLLPKMP